MYTHESVNDWKWLKRYPLKESTIISSGRHSTGLGWALRALEKASIALEWASTITVYVKRKS
jgi:hypothetical protein